MSSSRVEKLKPNAPLSWHSIMPGATMRPPRSMVTSGRFRSSKKVAWLWMILPVSELTQRSSSTSLSPLTRRQLVNLVRPFRGRVVGESAMGILGITGRKLRLRIRSGGRERREDGEDGSSCKRTGCPVED